MNIRECVRNRVEVDWKQKIHNTNQPFAYPLNSMENKNTISTFKSYQLLEEKVIQLLEEKV